MIINTGMRTDIPAFYSEWFANRLSAGYVMVRNPYNPKLVTKYVLDREVVDCIGFCTKNPAPMLSKMPLLKGFGQYWYVTITPYGRDIEPGVLDKYAVIDSFIELSKMLGKECVGWRYDPIFVSKKYTMEYHVHAFKTIAQRLAGYTDTCVISFIDLYAKVRRNFPEVQEVPKEERLMLGKAMVDIARDYGMVVKPCAEGDELAPYGADCRGCMTIETYEKAIHAKLHVLKNQAARKECACYIAADIGAYNTCGHLCRYCYANASQREVLENRKLHDPCSPLLIGHLEEGDVVHEAKQKSFLERQMALFE